MKTTHIGSLPFKIIDDMVEFNKKLDLPTLSTLPRLSNSELMLEQLCFGIKEAKIVNFKIHFEKLEFVENYNINFLSYDAFKDQFNHKEIKFHLCGPITFLSSINKTLTSNEKEELLTWYLSILKNTYKAIEKDFKDVSLCLDEPKLFEYPSFEKEFNKVIKALDGFRIGIHFCCKINPTLIDLSHFSYLSFDLSLFNKEEVLILKNYGDLIYGIINYKGEFSPLLDILSEGDFISPSCGLGLSSEKEAKNILEKLIYFNLQNHQV